jgi:hypothetical protein
MALAVMAQVRVAGFQRLEFAASSHGGSPSSTKNASDRIMQLLAMEQPGFHRDDGMHLRWGYDRQQRHDVNRSRVAQIGW